MARRGQTLRSDIALIRKFVSYDTSDIEAERVRTKLLKRGILNEAHQNRGSGFGFVKKGTKKPSKYYERIGENTPNVVKDY